jgi:hypothetical protein
MISMRAVIAAALVSVLPPLLQLPKTPTDPIIGTTISSSPIMPEHCPKEKDTVVWLDPQSGLFESKGHGTCGLSGLARYACRGEAERAGMHAAPN